MPIRRLEKSYTGTTSTIGGDELAASTIPVKPHIQPGVLQPAVAGKDLNGTALGGSYVYGTAHTDGHSYYYTDIKGSKPIKDPRIGAHFGSQRHRISSLQKLEQETMIHGMNVYSIDGREWMRLFSTPVGIQGNNVRGTNISVGNVTTDTVNFEIVGYFNDVNILMNTDTAFDHLRVTLNGGTVESTNLNVSTEGPLAARYVRSGSVINLTFDSTPTLGINTVKISNTSGNELVVTDFELIVQDTSSTANKSKIQIPVQNVVSYGKKFAIPATAQHYNPFDGMSGAKTLAQLGDYIDTATSLGMENWKAGTSNYYKPFNGGRVIKWVDSSGTIKTSVTMMPPNAQNMGGITSNAISNTEVQNGTNGETINFDTTTIANATPLSELAKSYHWREFGNGAANGGVGASWADVSMVTTSADDIGYVMDDGLTSFTADDARIWSDIAGGLSVAGNKTVTFTFIGTGLTLTQAHGTSNTYGIDNGTYAQNLPYGTHVFKYTRVDSGGGNADTIHINGVLVYTDTSTSGWIGGKFWNIHQPKKPPVPEDACILADYMLMADFVPQTSSGEIGKISKGSRLVSASRDFFHDTANGGLSLSAPGDGRLTVAKGGMLAQYTNMNVNENGPQLTWFGDAKMVNEAVGVSDSTERIKHYFDGATTNVTVTSDYTDSGAITTGLPSTSTEHYQVYGTKTTGEMGTQTSKFACHPDDTSNDWLYYVCAQVATPIHTSSHYQDFETPYLYELVGGDRNMEQTNLVVTSDGKTWDQVTRDTSYLGASASFSIGHPDSGSSGMTASSGASGSILSIFTNRRGEIAGEHLHNKGIIMAYDRWIVPVDGWYRISLNLRNLNGTEIAVRVVKNGTNLKYYYALGGNNDHGGMGWSQIYYMKREDTWSVNLYTGTFRNQYKEYSSFSCEKVERN